MNKLIITLLLIICPLSSRGQNFVYPVPPDSISEIQERINYMAEHFWTEKTVADTTNFQSPKLLLDYIYLLKRTDKQEKFVKRFLSMACRQESTFGLILFWLDNILYDSSSPQYDEAVYLMMMDAVVRSDVDSVMKLIPYQRIEMIKKNQVGGKANDFLFEDKEGNINSLYALDAPILLLVFNNPDCSLCHHTEESISHNEMIQSMLNSGRLKVLAVTPDADYKDWMEHKYPSNWLVGYDKNKTIYNQRLYDIQRLPCIYLLDKDKRVLLKEADYNRLVKCLPPF